MYVLVKRLAEFKGHAKAYFIHPWYPNCVNIIRLDKVHEDWKEQFVKQLREWLKEGKLYKPE